MSTNGTTYQGFAIPQPTWRVIELLAEKQGKSAHDVAVELLYAGLDHGRACGKARRQTIRSKR